MLSFALIGFAFTDPTPVTLPVCELWTDQNVYPALLLPEAWGSELPLKCLSDWKTANPERDAANFAFSFGTHRLRDASDGDGDEPDGPGVAGMMTAEPWSNDDGAKHEFIAYYRVLQNDNATNGTDTTPTPTSQPTSVPSAALIIAVRPKPTPTARRVMIMAHAASSWRVC